MSRDRKVTPRPPLRDPVSVHGEEVDDRGPDLATMVHANAKAICTRLGVPCGAQANLPEGLCIADYEPCPHARGPSGRPYAEAAATAAGDAGKKAGK